VHNPQIVAARTDKVPDPAAVDHNVGALLIPHQTEHYSQHHPKHK